MRHRATATLRRALALILSIALTVACGAAGARAFDDDRGRRIEISAQAPRIAALAPHLAELAFAAGAGARLVGVSSASDVPDEARAIAVVATSGRVDFERLMLARPDVVLAWQSGNSRAQVERLERSGVPVVVTEVRTMPDMPRLVRLIGRIAGTDETAERAALRLEREIDALAGMGRRPEDRSPRIFVEIWHQPLMTVNGRHLISEMVRACGGVNVFDGASSLTPVVSREALLKAAPDVVVAAATRGREEEALARWRAVPLPASRSRQVYAIEARALHDLGPLALGAARELCSRMRDARTAG
jgi:iron complex transport system substrate-binding protein